MSISSADACWCKKLTDDGKFHKHHWTGEAGRYILQRLESDIEKSRGARMLIYANDRSIIRWGMGETQSTRRSGERLCRTSHTTQAPVRGMKWLDFEGHRVKGQGHVSEFCVFIWAVGLGYISFSEVRFCFRTSVITLRHHIHRYRPIKAWNNLPQSVRSADSLDSFKRTLKFYLFNSCFNVWTVYVCVLLL